MSRASELFNALPREQRRIASALVIETQINQIRTDQEEAKDAHRRFMTASNAHARNLEAQLAARLAEIDGSETAQP